MTAVKINLVGDQIKYTPIAVIEFSNSLKKRLSQIKEEKCNSYIKKAEEYITYGIGNLTKEDDKKIPSEMSQSIYSAAHILNFVANEQNGKQ